MSTFSDEYCTFRIGLVNSTISRSELKSLKLLFHSEINSQRRESCINTLEELIQTLEKRGYLGEDKIENFANRIAASVPGINISEMMARYQSQRSGQRIYVGQFTAGGASAPAYSHPHSATSEESVDSDVEIVTRLYSVLPVTVMERIERDIGGDWKKLARALSVREGEIDKIESSKTRNEERAHKCLKSFLKDTDPYMVPSKLLNALEECGRRDLKKAVETRLTGRHF